MINSSAVASILYIIFTFAIVSISSFVTHDKCHHSHNIAKPSPINIPSASCPRLTTLQSHHNIHLVSLPYTDTDSIDDEDDDSSSDDNIDTNILLKKCWQWKDSHLGDGANNIVARRQRRRRRARLNIPRALTIQQFQELFIGMKLHIVIDEDTKMKVVLKNTQTSLDNDIVIDVPSSSKYITNNTTPSSSSYITNNAKAAIEETSFTIEECSVISTCARMNIVFVLQSDTNNDTIAERIATQYAVAYTIQQQLHFTSYQSTKEKEKEMHLIANELKHIEGSRSISTHLCLVACGLATRPDKSTSEVIFRPFDSQDAHILMQIKRSVEIVSVMGEIHAKRDAHKKHKGKNRQNRRRSSTGRRKIMSKSNTHSTSCGRIKTLLDTALTAGKKARNEVAIPEISSLKEYSKDDTPDEIMLPTRTGTGSASR